MSKAARAVLVVKPNDFEYNVETASDNEFMHVDADARSVREAALSEFSNLVHTLRAAGVQVIVFDKASHADLEGEKMPDAVFPNNWISTDHTGKVIIYPMAAGSRNREKQAFRFIIEQLLNNRFKVETVRNFAPACEDGLALEGTGALIIDHRRRRVFCSRSKRAHEPLLREWASENDCEPVVFDSRSSRGQPFYHTNVLLSIGDRFAVVCEDAIVPEDRARVLAALREDREVIVISLEQAEQNFCANILELSSDRDTSIIVMSQTAYDGFTPEQRAKLESFGELAVCPIPFIEKVGGGSARCMLAEIFLPQNKINLK